MIWILLAMLGIVLLAALVVVYVAFPHRGQEVPHAAWLGRVMRSGASMLPTVDRDDAPAAGEQPVGADRESDRGSVSVRV